MQSMQSRQRSFSRSRLNSQQSMLSRSLSGESKSGADTASLAATKNLNRSANYNIITNNNNNNKVHPIGEAMLNRSVSDIDLTDDFQVHWHNLCYSVDTMLPKREKRTILNNLNGYFKSGELTAIMGPSGAGKSSLLESICGRKTKGVSGQIGTRGASRLTISFVPQNDYLMGELTVRENLVFSSQFRAISGAVKGPVDHQAVAIGLIKRFGLETVDETLLRNCSGGQRKRLSIALEVLAKPNILICDEPTTGLDSPSCTQVLGIMHELVAQPKPKMAIVCTVHQPSTKLFNAFNSVYILSNNGKSIYHGSPLALVDTLSGVGLQCPAFNSPADYIIEIASGDYGSKPINELAAIASGRDVSETEVSAESKPLSAVTNRVSHSFVRQFPLLYMRSQITLYRNPNMTIWRILITLFMAIVLTLLFGDKVGNGSGCLPSELELYSRPLTDILTKVATDFGLMGQNIALSFIGLMIGLISGLAPILLYFPAEMHVFKKEYHNGWYSCLSYFVAKSLSDIPLQILLPGIYFTIIYNFTGQPPQIMRAVYLLLITVLLSFSSQSIGESCSAIWMNHESTAVFVGLMIPLPMILFGGFLIKISRMPFYMRPLSWLSLLRYSFEALLVSMYGFGRCDYQNEAFRASINESAVVKPTWMEYFPMAMAMFAAEDEPPMTDVERIQKMLGGSFAMSEGRVDADRSLIIGFFGIDDSLFARAIIVLCGCVVGLKVVTYYVLRAKLHAQS